MFPVTVTLFDVSFSHTLAQFLDINVIEEQDTSAAAFMA